MPFYPNAHFILPLTTIRRERQLPPDTTPLEVLVKEGQQRVEADTPVLRGARSSSYRIVSLREPLRLKPTAEIDPSWIRVAVNDHVSEGDTLAQRGSGRRAPRAIAPVDGLVIRVDADRLILQANPEEIEIRAVAPGAVAAVRGRTTVLIESNGVLIQGAWGNGRNAYGLYAEEPEGGLQTLADEQLLTTLRGQILLLTRPLTRDVLTIARRQEVIGIIAPSMSSTLRVVALDSPIAVILTEGFGEQQMSQIVYNLLLDNRGRQTVLDAVEPSRWLSDRPEIFIQLPSSGSQPPEHDQPLAAGMMVRLARAPYSGMTGTVRRVIDTPRALENGLRLAGAEIQLTGGKVVFAPIANIELLGRNSKT